MAPLFFRKLGRNAFYALAAVPAASFVWLLARFQYTAPVRAPRQPSGRPSEVVPWIPGLQLELAFRMDAAGLGHVPAGSRRRRPGAASTAPGTSRHKDSDLGAFGAQLLAFAGAMFGLVTADDLLLLFIFWELTTVLSYLLIGYARTRLAARRSALQALMVTTAGGLAMLVGLIMLGHSAGTYRISAILEQAPALADGDRPAPWWAPPSFLSWSAP